LILSLKALFGDYILFLKALVLLGEVNSFLSDVFSTSFEELYPLSYLFDFSSFCYGTCKLKEFIFFSSIFLMLGFPFSSFSRIFSGFKGFSAVQAFK
jgi:hypothetical protein